MLINVVFTVGTLLLCFLGTTSADDCYHGGYTFGDLLDDADLNSTIKPWCQSYDGKQYKNGETIPNACIDFRSKHNAKAHINLHIAFVISEQPGITKFTADACKEILFLVSKRCHQGASGKTIKYDGQHASDPQEVSARSFRSAKDRSGEGDHEENSGDEAQGNDEDGPFSTTTVITTGDTTDTSTTTFTPALTTRTVLDIVSTTETETTWETGTTWVTRTTQPTSSSSSSTSTTSSSKSFNQFDCLLAQYMVQNRPEECSKFTYSPKPKSSTSTTSSSTTGINTAYMVNIKMDPNGYGC